MRQELILLSPMYNFWRWGYLYIPFFSFSLNFGLMHDVVGLSGNLGLGGKICTASWFNISQQPPSKSGVSLPGNFVFRSELVGIRFSFIAFLDLVVDELVGRWTWIFTSSAVDSRSVSLVVPRVVCTLLFYKINQEQYFHINIKS